MTPPHEIVVTGTWWGKRPVLSNGREGFDGPRACRAAELAPALDLVNAVFRDGRTGPQGGPLIAWDYAHIYHRDNLSNVRVVLDGQRPIASVGIHATRLRTPRGAIGVGGINCLATHSDYRQRGLGAAVMADAHAQMRAQGLHVGLLGTSIPHFYRKLGWERAGIQQTFLLDRASIALLPQPADLEVSPDWPAAAAELAALHDREPLGAHRPADLFALLAERKVRTILVGRRAGRVAAYVALRDANVREYAGGAADVAALLRHAFAGLDDPSLSSTERLAGQRHAVELTVHTPAGGARTRSPATDGEPAPTESLPALLHARGIPYSIGYIGMLKLLRPAALFTALGLDEVDLRRHEGGWELRHRGRSLLVTEHQLVKLVFGPERFPDVAPDLLPVPFYQWPVDRV